MTPEQKRLRSIYDKLLKSGEVNSMRDFSLKIKYNQATIQQVLTYKRHVTALMMRNTVKYLGINESYMFDGKGKMRDKEPVKKLEIDLLKSRISDLERTVKAISKIIHLQ